MFLSRLKTSPREIRGMETESVPGFFKWSVNERGRGKLVAARNSGIFSLCASARRWPVSRASKPAPMFLIGPRSRAAILRVLLRNLHFARDPSTLEVWIYRRKHYIRVCVYNNPACFEPSPFKTEIYPRIILAFSLNHFWRGVMLHIPATNETYKRDTVKKKGKRLRYSRFEYRFAFFSSPIN